MKSKKSKWDYLLRVKSAIEHRHKCPACYIHTQSVDETVSGKTVWIGDVEVFALLGHPKARHCYAWIHHQGKKDEGEERIFAVLEIPPVDSPQAAVRASIISDANKEPWTGQFLAGQFRDVS